MKPIKAGRKANNWGKRLKLRPHSSEKWVEQTGFTLVELLVSLVLGLVLISGVLNLFLSNRESFRVNENLSRMQENSRTAFDIMSRSVREAGENYCGTVLIANVVRSAPSTIPWWADWDAGTVKGFDGNQNAATIVAFGTSSGSRVTGTDAIVVLQAEQEQNVIASHSTGTNEITLQNITGLGADDIVIGCDMQSAAIFQIGTVSTSLKLIDYTPAMTTLNCGNGLAYPTATACAATTSKEFTAGGVIAKLSAAFWYVGFNAAGQRSLYRCRITKQTTGGVTTVTTVREEVLTGVQDLQIDYLTKDISSSNLSTAWIPASHTTFDTASGAWTSTNTNQVVAARISLTLQSADKVSINNDVIQRQMIHVVGLRSRDTLFQSSP